jgi:hypothetical protein
MYFSGMYFSAIDSRPPPSNVHMLGFVTDEISRRSKSVLLRLSVADERFGLPAVAAMAWAAQSSRPTRRVCRRSAAMPRRSEPRGWLAEIERLRAEPDLARDLRAKGARQTGRFS